MQDSLFMLISDGMKRFLLKLGLFFSLILVADIALGGALGYLANHAKVDLRRGMLTYAIDLKLISC